MEQELAVDREDLATKADLAAIKHELIERFDAQCAAIRVEIKGVEASLMRWVLTCILGQTAVLAGLGYFFLGHFSR